MIEQVDPIFTSVRSGTRTPLSLKHKKTGLTDELKSIGITKCESIPT